MLTRRFARRPGVAGLLGAGGLGLAVAPAPAQITYIFSNQGTNVATPALATGASTLSGMPAPSGSQWSECPAEPGRGASALAGVTVSADQDGVHRVADDFIVSNPGGWIVERLAVYAYLTSTAPGAPFSAATVRILRGGPPGAPGSSVVWGDTTTNRLQSQTATNVYRVFNSVTLPLGPMPDLSRRVWRVELNIPLLSLAPGTYWVDWQLVTTDPGARALSPTVTVAGVRSGEHFNARQFTPVNGVAAWAPIVDGGKPSSSADLPVDLPFILMGRVPAPGCAGDGDGNGVVTFSDIESALRQWNTASSTGPLAGDANHDGVVDFADIVAILANWGSICQAP
ncbi:MAG: hypothetical protein SFZ24_09225 [Planctomycetota bacterium]|nr:hypothetical protein [Planctomycetota bacterium]